MPIKIEWKDKKRRGEDDYQYVSIRMKKEIVDKLDAIAAKTNRSRNNIVNILLEEVIDTIEITKKS